MTALIPTISKTNPTTPRCERGARVEGVLRESDTLLNRAVRVFFLMMLALIQFLIKKTQVLKRRS
jgi:hypothetical protein